MGIAELNNDLLTVRSDFFFYGGMSSPELAGAIAGDIQRQWNEPQVTVTIKRKAYLVRFVVRGFHEASLNPETVWYNTDPKNNYFRIEAFSKMHVSFVDGIHCNTGYLKYDNLLHPSTTAAHEFGHTIGLVHPRVLDIRGKGQPGIMYPRGTICDPEFQYDPMGVPLGPGGTMNPVFRKVLPHDIASLELPKLRFNKAGFAVLGDFSSLYHEKAVEGI